MKIKQGGRTEQSAAIHSIAETSSPTSLDTLPRIACPGLVSQNCHRWPSFHRPKPIYVVCSSAIGKQLIHEFPFLTFGRELPGHRSVPNSTLPLTLASGLPLRKRTFNTFHRACLATRTVINESLQFHISRYSNARKYQSLMVGGTHDRANDGNVYDDIRCLLGRCCKGSGDS